MDLRTYFYGLDPTGREAFARRAQTTVEYIQCHLITRRKIPRPDSMRKLAAASQDQVSLDDLLDYFYKTTRGHWFRLIPNAWDGEDFCQG